MTKLLAFFLAVGVPLLWGFMAASLANLFRKRK